MSQVGDGVIGGTSKVRLSIVALIAVLALAGCGKSSNGGSGSAAEGRPLEPNNWTCAHFEQASSKDLAQALSELGAETQLRRGGGDAVKRAIDEICRGKPPDFKPASLAVQKAKDEDAGVQVQKEAAPAETPASEGSGGGSGGSVAPPADPQRSEEPKEEGGGCCGGGGQTPQNAPPSGPQDEGEGESGHIPEATP